jgi:hypothetical protein
MKKLMIVACLASFAVPAVAQFPGIKLDTKAIEKAVKKDGDKAAKEAEKTAKDGARAALKADLIDTLALPRGDAKVPTTFLKLSAALSSAELDFLRPATPRSARSPRSTSRPCWPTRQS